MAVLATGLCVGVRLQAGAPLRHLTGRDAPTGWLDSHGRARRASLPEQGHEPHVEGASITLRNCPFHSLSEEHQDLVCGKNLELIRGVLAAANVTENAAQLEPKVGRCYVKLVI